jgi:DNA invertase Pin-like site-specific DNA recombinase
VPELRPKATLVEDKRERSTDCENPACDYSTGFDWDAEAERRAEARYATAHRGRSAVSQPPKAILYAAKSTEDKHGSIPDQLNDGRKLASERDLDAVAEYSDEAASAYHGDRGPGLVRAMAHCEQIAPCALIVQHSDRLARGDAKQARHLIEIVLWAIKNDVALLSVQDPEMLSGGEMGLLMGVIGGMRNHQDSKRKSAAVKSGMRRAAERGQFIGGRRPYGYRHRDTDDDGSTSGPLVVDGAEAAVVRRIFSDYLRAASQRQIAITLNDERVPTLTGTRWYATTVAGMLRNPLYKGWVTHNGESYPAVAPDGQPTHEPIIDAETWERARQRREALSDGPGRGRGRRTRGSHLFTGGLLRCSCGAPMSPVTKPTRTPGKLYEVYTCAHRLHHGAGACTQPPIKREAVDAAVWRYFQDVAFDAQATRESITAEAQRSLAELNAQHTQAERELARTESALERIESDYIAGEIDAKRWTRLEARLRSEMEAAREQAAQHARQRTSVEAAIAQFDTDAVLIEELSTIRKLVAGEAQDGSQDGLESFRIVLRRLFVGFELLTSENWMGSGALAGQGQLDDSLRVGGGYSLLPCVRPEAVDYAVDSAEDWPAIRRASLSFSDNFQARLPAW